MKPAVTAVLAFWMILATHAALAEECDKFVAAKLNSEAQDELQRLDVSPHVSAVGLLHQPAP